MGSKSLNRRELLKSSAALAGGLTLGGSASDRRPAVPGIPPRAAADDQGRQGWDDRRR